MRPRKEKGREVLILGSLGWPLTKDTFQLSPDE